MDSPKDSRKDTQPAGRVKHDASGRAIWEWAAETGRHALDSTSRLLKRLDLPGLKLADEAKPQEEESAAPSQSAQDGKAVPTFGGQREQDPLAHSRKSFNPYDNRTPIKRAPPRTAAPPRITQPPAPKPGLLARIFKRSR
jgi:hypothetical protein